MTEQIKYTSMDFSLDDVLHDYKIVENSICDEKTFQEADDGLVLSELSDAIKYLEDYKRMKNAWPEVLNELEKLKQEFKNDKNIHGAIAVNISIKRIKEHLVE